MTPLKPVSDRLYVAGQIAPENFSVAVEKGVHMVICNRPDGESPGQPTAQQMAHLAKEHGLSFAHIPVAGGQITPDAIARMERALEEGWRDNGRVLAYCLSGMRSTALWAAAMVASKRQGVADVVSAAQMAGYDLTPLAPMLHMLEAQRPS
ncbi:NAD(FAD)-dependent dehydrogenase [Iodidimonas gelatinilytica]|uniref:NAD(FAD)-dependent dehydrogenase n=1 Tax=Iodidimonas gelatinilytica TaxID=1236966 RepID=A0A5A7MQF9_9PROT|nr:TIGR01244 family sulfur transferase [Iodidimonas gelatinilytica]GEQ98056.1 NAD(FAD)-dependent dehydrogenase [Iodidimonas gelatinilytica]GEQ99823.1 NAD(FAD)-dependent dehydrogenase [Iodidimonas gelatinilytica]